MEVISIQRLREMLERGSEDPGFVDRSMDLMQRWLGRGDGVAVYLNMALDSASVGSRKYLSFGSEKAQIEPSGCGPDGLPPERMPDIQGLEPGWRYRLEAVCLPEGWGE